MCTDAVMPSRVRDQLKNVQLGNRPAASMFAFAQTAFCLLCLLLVFFRVATHSV